MTRRHRSLTLSAGVATLAACVFGCQTGDDEVTAPPEVTASTAPETKQTPEVSTPAAVVSTVAQSRPLLEQVLAYGEGRDNNLTGFLAMPSDAVEPPPGVIVIHEWWGLDDSIKTVARRLADEGYVALAVDLYGGATAQTADEAQRLMTGVLEDPEAAASNLSQAYDYLEKYALAPRIGVVGWGLGGSWSLQVALRHPDTLDAMVTFYGQVVTDREQLASLRVPVLGFFGADDASVPVRQVQEFRNALTSLGKDAEVYIVTGAGNAFATPSGIAHNEDAAVSAWDQTLSFLDARLAN